MDVSVEGVARRSAARLADVHGLRVVGDVEASLAPVEGVPARPGQFVDPVSIGSLW